MVAPILLVMIILIPVLLLNRSEDFNPQRTEELLKETFVTKFLKIAGSYNCKISGSRCSWKALCSRVLKIRYL
jgi:hypothetical protein